MREILFRGKNHAGWHFGSPIECKDGIYIQKSTGGFISIESFLVYPKTIGQYTGLKDKNRKKIFEGDIINVRFDFGYGLCDCPAVVVYDELGFKFKSLAGIDYAVGDLFEIIGNIHDNPELLECEVER